MVSEKAEKVEKAEKAPLQSEVNIGLVGHVDHGKTSITKMLTGKWTDTHSEEIKRGISIRLGYADVVIRKCSKCKGLEAYTTDKKCSHCDSATKVVRRISFVDAPGHETLMATMLSGAALMQGAILVVAANEKCPQARTIEHLMAIKLSGIKDLIVVQNKIDLVTEEQAKENYNDIKKFLQEYEYNNAPIIPVAANLGINKDALICAMEEYLKTPETKSNDKLKMYVVRSFDVNSPGNTLDKLKGGVLGGSIVSGSIKIGDEIELSPGLEKGPVVTKVVSLATESGRLEKVVPGGLVAIGTLFDPSVTQNDKMKGQVLSNPGVLPAPTKKIKLKYKSIDRLLVDDLKKPLIVNEAVVLTIGTATNVGKISAIKNDLIDFDLSQPNVVEKDQRVAISRRSSNGWRLYGYGFVQ